MDVPKILDKPKQLIALTSLTREEFDLLLPPFRQAWLNWYKHYGMNFKRRSKPLTARQLQRPTATLSEVEDKLFFILYHFKTNHLQEDYAAILDMDQGMVSKWIKILEPLLEKALRSLNVQPARNAEELRRHFDARQQHQEFPNSKPKARTLGADATDRPIGRSVDQETQKRYYTGKHRKHTVKNSVLADEYQFVHFLGSTYRGARHDKTILDEELPDFKAPCFEDLWLSKDSGYQGYRPEGVHLLEPFKARRNHPLTEFEKTFNHWVSKVRITVENAIGSIKKLRLVKERWRGKTLERIDRCMSIATGLHNLRIVMRQSTYQKATQRIDELLFF